jgi:hypothetical protein
MKTILIIVLIVVLCGWVVFVMLHRRRPVPVLAPTSQVVEPQTRSC